MSWTFSIGEPIVRADPNDDEQPVYVAVKYIIFPKPEPLYLGAPDSNRVSLVYSYWFEFLKRTRLQKLFGRGAEEELINADRSISLIRYHHLDEIHFAISTWKPTGKPGWEQKVDQDGNALDIDLGFMLWFEYWFRYALEHFDIPVISYL